MTVDRLPLINGISSGLGSEFRWRNDFYNFWNQTLTKIIFFTSYQTFDHRCVFEAVFHEKTRFFNLEERTFLFVRFPEVPRGSLLMGFQQYATFKIWITQNLLQIEYVNSSNAGNVLSMDILILIFCLGKIYCVFPSHTVRGELGELLGNLLFLKIVFCVFCQHTMQFSKIECGPNLVTRVYVRVILRE